MPRVAGAPQPEPELEPEPMDIHERAAEPKSVAEHDKQPKEEEEYEETITLRAADFYALQDTLNDIQFQIVDIQRDAHRDRLETQDMLRAILDWLPPAP
jgi:hypothetical protein